MYGRAEQNKLDRQVVWLLLLSLSECLFFFPYYSRLGPTPQTCVAGHQPAQRGRGTLVWCLCTPLQVGPTLVSHLVLELWGTVGHGQSVSMA